MDCLDLLAVQETLKSLLQHHSSKASILWHSAFFIVQLSHPYITTGKTIALTRRTFVGKVMSLLFNMLSRLVITFLPRSNSVRLSSVTQSCPTFCDPMNCSMPGVPVHHQLPEFTQTHVQVSDTIQPSHPLSSPSPSAPNPSQHQDFSNESTLHMKWPKYWNFSFSIISSKEHPGPISFRMDWLDLLSVQFSSLSHVRLFVTP